MAVKGLSTRPCCYEPGRTSYFEVRSHNIQALEANVGQHSGVSSAIFKENPLDTTLSRDFHLQVCHPFNLVVHTSTFEWKHDENNLKSLFHFLKYTYEIFMHPLCKQQGGSRLAKLPPTELGKYAISRHTSVDPNVMI